MKAELNDLCLLSDKFGFLNDDSEWPERCQYWTDVTPPKEVNSVKKSKGVYWFECLRFNFNALAVLHSYECAFASRGWIEIRKLELEFFSVFFFNYNLIIYF